VIILKIIKQYGKTIGIFLGILFILSFVIAILNSLNIIYSKGSDIIILVGMILTLFIIGLEYGKKAEKKGFLEGLKIGGSLIFILILINLIFYQTGCSIERFIYYAVLILSSTLGSMLGINKKH